MSNKSCAKEANRGDGGIRPTSVGPADLAGMREIRKQEDRQSTDADLVIERNLVPLSRQRNGSDVPLNDTEKEQEFDGRGRKVGEGRRQASIYRARFSNLRRHVFSSLTSSLRAIFPPPKMRERPLL